MSRVSFLLFPLVNVWIIDYFSQSADLSVPGEEEPITGIEDMLRVSSITQAGEESQRMGAVVVYLGE